MDVAVPAPVLTCGTCGYRGDGMPYFRRTEHAALLVGAALVTYGVGGLVYWLVRRESWVCPGCGTSWARPSEIEGSRRAAGHAPLYQPSPAPFNAPAHPPFHAPNPRLPAGGLFRRVFGALLAVGGVSVLVVAVSEASAVVLAVAVGLGLCGILLFRWGRQAQERRREGLLVSLQNQALHLARARSGRLTATDAATALRLTLPAAERVLFSMDDGFRVRSDITREGLLVFDFPEVRLALLEEGSSGLGRTGDLA